MSIKINNAPKYRRRRFVVALLFVASFLGVSKATSDVCWTGSGYGSCTAMVDAMLAKQKAEEAAIARDRALAEKEWLKDAKVVVAPVPKVPASKSQAYAKKVAKKEYGWGNDQFSCLVKLWNKESNWRSNAVSPTKDHGIPQRHMPKHTKEQIADFMSSAVVQIDWGLSYIKHRYQTPCRALSFHNSRNWY